ncbi:AAA family ATPase [Rhodococcus hoagii]|nr:AAA family ATPase [Prescottella equi]
MGLPADTDAEESLLGLVLLHPERVAGALLSVAPDDWLVPKHKELAAVISGMLRNKRSVDPVTVFGQVQAQGLSAKLDGYWIYKLTERAFRPESANDLAARIRELSGQRKLMRGAERLLMRFEESGNAGEDLDVKTATNELRRYCDEAEQVAAEKSIAPPRNMGDFLNEPDSYNWLVPGMLERMERIILTGAEGGGKSVLCSQLAACMAGGIHPFTSDLLGEGDQGIRVLVIDCENSAAQSRRRYRMVVNKVNEVRTTHDVEPVDWGEQMFIDMRPAGIDLLSARDVSWLEHAISSTAPDLLVMGPLYKLHHENPNDETAARELTWVLDGLRERHGFALLTEAHAGNATDMNGNRNMRPIGSSLFRRWSEYGFGLARSKTDPGKPRAEIVDVVSWRGSREERLWPQQLQYGAVLPWMPGPQNVEYYDEVASALHTYK